MKNLFKNFFVIFLFIFFIFNLWSSSAYAASEFSNAYDVTYDVRENGDTIVTQNVHLTNLTTNYYASEYSLTFGTEKIEEVSAWDGAGLLKVDVKKGTDLTQIHVVFNERVVGQGKTLNWTLRYQSEEIAKKLGRIWEINIPRVAQEEQATSYNVTLIVPPTFGQPAYVWPKPRRQYRWTIEDGSRDGITLAFGDWQGFTFDLTYHLENSSVTPSETFIAIPPDTSYQKVILNEITPFPNEIVVDEDGNWLAKYFLLPKQKQEIKVNGLAQVFLTPRIDYPKEDSQQIRQKYLKPQKFWEQDPKISKLAKELATPEAIYNYVVSTLTYDYQRARSEATRLGAKQALATPDKAICMEFTDLFIALSRAAGIPAREVDGYAYTANSRLKPLSLVTDVLHSWPEYWDEKSQLWLQVDPTWGKTSLINYFSRFDFNHLAFVVRGINSTSPYPAGSYKSEKGGKDVLVDFSSPPWADFVSSPDAAEVQLIFPKKIIAGLPLTGQVKIKNGNKVALYNLGLNLTSSLLTTPPNFLLKSIPPKASKTLLVKLENSNPFLYGKNVLTASLNKTETSIAFQIIPLPFLVLPAVLGVFILILLIRLIVKKIWIKFLKKS